MGGLARGRELTVRLETVGTSLTQDSYRQARLVGIQRAGIWQSQLIPREVGRHFLQ